MKKITLLLLLCTALTSCTIQNHLGISVISKGKTDQIHIGFSVVNFQKRIVTARWNWPELSGHDRFCITINGDATIVTLDIRTYEFKLKEGQNTFQLETVDNKASFSSPIYGLTI